MTNIENNLALTGDEARFLVHALTQCTLAVPFNAGLELLMRLRAISDVQPPTPLPKDESQ